MLRSYGLFGNAITNRILAYQMKKRGTLIETNPFLADPKMREKLLFEHAVASATIEGMKDARRRGEKLLRGKTKTPATPLAKHRLAP